MPRVDLLVVAATARERGHGPLAESLEGLKAVLEGNDAPWMLEVLEMWLASRGRGCGTAIQLCAAGAELSSNDFHAGVCTLAVAAIADRLGELGFVWSDES